MKKITQLLLALVGLVATSLSLFAGVSTEEEFLTMHKIPCRVFHSYEDTTNTGASLIVWNFSASADSLEKFEILKHDYLEAGRIRVVDASGRMFLNLEIENIEDCDSWNEEVRHWISETRRAFLGKDGRPIFLVRKIDPPAQHSANSEESPESSIEYWSWTFSTTGTPPSLPGSPAILQDWYETGEGTNVPRTTWQYAFSGTAPYYENAFTLQGSCSLNAGNAVRISVSSDDTATLSVGGLSVTSTLYSGTVNDCLAYSSDSYVNLLLSIVYENIGGPYSLIANVESLETE